MAVEVLGRWCAHGARDVPRHWVDGFDFAAVPLRRPSVQERPSAREISRFVGVDDRHAARPQRHIACGRADFAALDGMPVRAPGAESTVQ